MFGWPDGVEQSLLPFQRKKNELSVLNGCLLRGARVVVPPPCRNSVLSELHETHAGCSKMKALARSYVWWPEMDSQIEELVKSCTSCQSQAHSPPSAPLHPWEWPKQPWNRIHLDFAGPFMGAMFLVIVDAHSKWLDVQIMPSITAPKTIERLRQIFAIHGLPCKIVSDNGPTFTSREFQQFTTENGIQHVFSAPYHPSSNGLAERAVQTFKQALKQMQPEGSLQSRLSRFLFKYNITPHTTTGIAPSELLMGRQLRSRLSLLYPDVASTVDHKQNVQKKGKDNQSPIR